MNNPNHPFQYNQSNLQDFIDCPRRFQLKSLEKRSWPAAHSLPIKDFEYSLELGNSFHTISQQYFSGVDPDQIYRTITDPLLSKMWENFLPFAADLRDRPHFAEQYLAINYLDSRIVAKYDLIVLLPDQKYLIFDWKTASRKPSPRHLSSRVQTYLYPFVLCHGGADLFNSGKPQPDSVILHYWYPLASDPEISFPYSGSDHQDTANTIARLISEISQLQDSGAVFPLTDDLSRCQFCPFRSYCGRGDQPGLTSKFEFAEEEELADIEFDLEQIMELEF